MMHQAAEPEISIIMPVFNTGRYLEDAIASVLYQQPLGDHAVPSFELVVIDDGSTDPETLDILDRFSKADSRIVLLGNQRKKGAAGARNAGILQARGAWLGFIDSDDVWMPASLAARWHHIRTHSEAQWVAGRFRFLKAEADARGVSVFQQREALWGEVGPAPLSAAFDRMEKPIAAFAKSCFIGTTTVLIRRALVLQKGLFNESLHRAEDYHLWFKCAFDNDLWMTQADVSFYRIHSASLTHGDAPRLLYEDQMIELLLRSPEANVHRGALLQRFDLVMQDTCYFYRGKKMFKKARHTALQWLRKRPLKAAAWKELAACCLQAG